MVPKKKIPLLIYTFKFGALSMSELGCAVFYPDRLQEESQIPLQTLQQ